MRPRLGPVLPGVRGGIGADVLRLPLRSGQGGTLVVRLQRLGVVAPLVAEECAEGVHMPGAQHQLFPVVVAGFMPQMTQQRAVGLMHGLAPARALVVIGLGHVEGHDTLGMPRHDGRRARHVRQEFIHRPGLLRAQQSQARQRVEQVPLGALYLRPAAQVVGQGQVRQHARPAAGGAQPAMRLGICGR